MKSNNKIRANFPGGQDLGIAEGPAKCVSDPGEISVPVRKNSRFSDSRLGEYIA